MLLVALLALAASRRSRNTSARVALGAAGVLVAGLAALHVLGYFAVVGFAVPLVRDPRAQRLVVVAVSIPVLVGPLLVVKPLGPRCFLPTDALCLVIVSVLLKPCLDEYGQVLGVATTVAALLVAALSLASSCEGLPQAPGPESITARIAFDTSGKRVRAKVFVM